MTTKLAFNQVEGSPIYPTTFGVIGDGVADDTAAWQAIATSLESSNNTVICNPNHEYKITSQIDFKVSAKIIGNGAKVKPVGCSGFIFGADATGTSTTLSADAQINTNSLTFTSVAGFSVGDLVKIQSSAAWMLDPTPSEGIKKGELGVIQRIDGSTVYLEGMLFDNYNISSETVTVTRIEKIKPHVKELEVIYNTPGAYVGIQVSGAVDSVLEDVTVHGAQTQGINVNDSYSCKIVRANITKSNGSSLGYGIQINDSYLIDIFDSHFSECRRGVDISGIVPSRKCRVWRNYADGSGQDSGGSDLTDNSGSSGFGSHEGSEHNSFRFNTVTGCRYHTLLRGKDEIVSDNEGLQDIKLAMVQVSKAINFTIERNHYSASLRPGKTLDVVASDDDEQKCAWFVSFTNLAIDGGFGVIRNNTFDELKNSFVAGNITVSAPFTNFKNLTITGNSGKVKGSTATTTGYIIEAVDQPFTISESVIINNDIVEDTAQLVEYDSAITIDYAETVDVDNVLLPASTVANGGGGTLVVDRQALQLTVKNGVVRIDGYVDFTISVSPTIVKLQNLPAKTLVGGTYGPAYSFPFVASVGTASVGAQGMVAMPLGVSGTIPTSAWLSSDLTAYNSSWAVGTHRVPVSITYYTERRRV
jgi:hypothetical protein